MNKVIFFIYFFSLISLSLISYFFIDPNLFYLHRLYTGIAFTNRLFVTLVYTLLISLLFCIYIFVMRRMFKKHIYFGQIVILIAVSISILFLAYPAILSYDIFNYIATAKVTYLYKENPYLVMPIDIPNEPMLSFMHAANKMALYGPVWILLTILPYLLGFGNFLLTLFLFKALVGCFYAGIVYIIWKISKNWLSVAFFALNPLILIETFVSSHNDVVMMFFALTSFYFLKRNKVLLSAVFIILSIGIKYATIFLLPVYIFILWKKINKSEIAWNKMYLYSGLSMMVIFFLSFIREEIYPWYAIWFLSFFALIPQAFILYILTALSFGLMLRYIPYMYFGSYFGITPYIRIMFTFSPVLLVSVFYLIKKRLL